MFFINSLCITSTWHMNQCLLLSILLINFISFSLLTLETSVNVYLVSEFLGMSCPVLDVINKNTCDVMGHTHRD